MFLESRSGTSFERFLTDSLDEHLRMNFYQEFRSCCTANKPKAEELSRFKEMLYRTYQKGERSNGDVLLDTVFSKYAQQGTSSEIIWYFKLLSYLNSSYDTELCRELMMYVRYKREYFKDKVQQNVIGGLDYFQNIYNSATNFLYDPQLPFSVIRENAYYSIFEEQCRTGNLKVLEVKISPKIISSSRTTLTSIEEIQEKTLSQIKLILKAYRRYINDRVERSADTEKLIFPKLGLVYHFIKQNDCDNFSGYSCIVKDRSQDFDCVDYSTMRILNIRFAEALKRLIAEYPLISDYVVGIDAASLENSIVWDMDKLLYSHFCPCRFEKHHEPIFIRISDEEIRMCKELQKELRSKVENLGIYVETNPSSNLAIGDIDSVFSHPILNLNHSGLGLNDSDDACVLTTINSDDPIIFSTNVENEIAYIYYGLLNAGCKRENVLNWIDKIRMHGINSTFVKYEKSYSEMADDFDEIQTYCI